MRWLICFFLVILMGGAEAQVQFGSPNGERLIIEVVPVPTLGAKMVQGEAISVTADYDAAFEKLYAGIDEALAVLGLPQDEYEVRVWTDDALIGELTIACDIFARWKSAIGVVIAGRTLPDAIGCHSNHGPFTTESESFAAATEKMVETFKGYTTLQLGKVYLFSILAPDELRWPGTAGNATAYKSVSPKSQYPYLNHYCIAFATNRPIVIAHELGHCFGLEHNTGRERHDLMYHAANRAFRLNESNRETVRRFFEEDSTEAEPIMGELHH